MHTSSAQSKAPIEKKPKHTSSSGSSSTHIQLRTSQYTRETAHTQCLVIGSSSRVQQRRIMSSRRKNQNAEKEHCARKGSLELESVYIASHWKRGREKERERESWEDEYTAGNFFRGLRFDVI